MKNGENHKSEEEKEEYPDRPLECGECQRPIAVHYSEIVGGTCTKTGMCSECPQLQSRLKGTAFTGTFGGLQEGGAGLACGECGTTLVSVKVGHLLGCSHCYEVFGDVLVEDLLASNLIAPGITKKKKSVPLHVGRAPGETQEISPSLRLMALNKALEETLKKEDYEQAAWLRDQIKELTGGEEGHDQKG